MNTASIYAKATGQRAPDVVPLHSPAEESLLFQQKADWLAHNETLKLFKSLALRAEELEAQARSQASTYHQHQNPHLATKCLIVAEELRNLIEQYGRTN